MTDRSPGRHFLAGWRIERRPEPRRIGLYRLTAVALGLALALILAPIISGASPDLFYETAWNGTLGSPLGIANFLAVATPLIIAGLAAAIPLRLGLWNIGIDGQILIGAWCATAVAYSFESLPGPILIPMLFIAGMIGGALWILVPALARVLLGVNEILTTFLLNFVANAWLIYWVTNAWLDVNSGGGGIRARPVPEQAELSLLNINGTFIHWGVIVALALPIALWAALRFSRTGFELTITGAGGRVGTFSGINVKRKQIGVMLAGGAMAGLAGTIDMLGTIHQYGEGLTNNRGFAAVVIAVLAGSSPLGVLVMGLVYALLLSGSDAVSVIGVSNELVYCLIGITLLTGAMGEAIARLRVVHTRAAAAAETPELEEATA
ncbi:MAG: ral nucleoside transport system permease protein [Solirubrobacterales bacterium]|jgi:simple sugar transport system permease protein|nr:ral nucleoside transport system permease protein [Solirubrobacterales bacterium]